jgi:aldose 1-epimerase
MSISVKAFGKTASGEEVSLYTVENKNGMKVSFTNYGAIVTELIVPDKNGTFADVVLGYDSMEGYAKNPGYLGAAIGRNGNRIANAEITINGVTHKLDKNEGENNLHAGFNGYDKRVWEAKVVEDSNSVEFSLFSPDGDQGFPGNFNVTVTYTVTDDNELSMNYKGTSDADTVANMTNHSYFNLGGHTSGTILDHIMWIKASKYVPVVDSTAIPTGEIAPVAGTPMDFTSPNAIGEGVESDFDQLKFTGGYDHNYAIDKETQGIEKIALVEDPKSGRKMEVYTDLPGVQLYVGNFIDTEGVKGKEGMLYQKRSGLCLETQYFPDAIHQANFESPVLKAGEEYNTTTIYKFL